MPTIVWNPQAYNNLQSIQRFYREEGVEEDIIENLLYGIFSSIERLVSHPLSGRVVPEINDPNFREIIWNNTWRIIYMPPNSADDLIEIMNVLHTAQNLGS